MIESELFSQHRHYSKAQEGKINPIIHNYLALVFLGDFHNHMEANTDEVATALTSLNSTRRCQTITYTATQ